MWRTGGLIGAARRAGLTLCDSYPMTGEAATILNFMPFAAAGEVKKVLKSAMFNLINHEKTPISESEAAELRREERRSLIAASRRALNRILVPAALGVLAPFMGILLYPALTTLVGSFH